MKVSVHLGFEKGDYNVIIFSDNHTSMPAFISQESQSEFWS